MAAVVVLLVPQSPAAMPAACGGGVTVDSRLVGSLGSGGLWGAGLGTRFGLATAGWCHGMVGWMVGSGVTPDSTRHRLAPREARQVVSHSHGVTITESHPPNHSQQGKQSFI